jgi:hypothetical protein
MTDNLQGKDSKQQSIVFGSAVCIATDATNVAPIHALPAYQSKKAGRSPLFRMHTYRKS